MCIISTVVLPLTWRARTYRVWERALEAAWACMLCMASVHAIPPHTHAALGHTVPCVHALELLLIPCAAMWCVMRYVHA